MAARLLLGWRRLVWSGGSSSGPRSSMAHCLLLESGSPEFEFQLRHLLVVRQQAGYFTSVSQTSHHEISLIAVSASWSGCEDKPVNHLVLAYSQR